MKVRVKKLHPEAILPLQLEGIQQVALFDQSAVQELQK